MGFDGMTPEQLRELVSRQRDEHAKVLANKDEELANKNEELANKNEELAMAKARCNMLRELRDRLREYTEWNAERKAMRVWRGSCAWNVLAK